MNFILFSLCNLLSYLSFILVWFGLVWFGLDFFIFWFGLVWFGLDRIELNWIWLDRIGLALFDIRFYFYVLFSSAEMSCQLRRFLWLKKRKGDVRTVHIYYNSTIAPCYQQQYRIFSRWYRVLFPDGGSYLRPVCISAGGSPFLCCTAVIWSCRYQFK